MLNIVQTYKISNAKLPLQYDFALGSCASFEDAGSSGDTIVVRFYFVDQTCYEQNKLVKLTIKDGDNCIKEVPVSITNPCDGFVVNEIKRVTRLKFRADVALTDATPYEYHWTWDPQVFEELNPAVDGKQGETIEFKLIKKLKKGDKTKIYVQVYNSHLCCATKVLNYTFCGPEAHDGLWQTVCVDGHNTTGRIILTVYPCDIDEACGQSDVPIDWGSLTLDLPSDRITWTNYGNGRIKIDFPDDWPTGKTNIKYCVKDTSGIESCAMLCILVAPCVGPGFGATPVVGLLGCTDCVAEAAFDTQDCKNSDILLPIEDYIFGSPDWSTFEFIAQPGQTIISLTEVQTPYGNFSIRLDRVVKYSPADFQGIDSIQYKLKTITGESFIGDITIKNTPECIDTGVSSAVTVDDEVCVKCGQSVTFNPLGNDTGDIDPSTVEADFPPPEVGVLEVFSDGKMKFTANDTFSGDYILPYTVRDIYGKTSNESNINLTVYCDITNELQNQSLCKKDSDSVDLFDLLNSTDNTHSWTLNSVSFDEKAYLIVDGKGGYYNVGDVVGKDWKPVISFVNSKVGTYVFAYGDGIGSCSNKVLLSIEILDPVEFPSGEETIHACITDAKFDFTTRVTTDLPSGGTWSNVDPGTLDVPIFDPSNGVGKYTFKYKIENFGSFSQACDSEFVLHIIVHDTVYAGEDVCVKVCSGGPDTGDPGFGCRDPKVISKYEPGECEICLFDTLFQNPGKIKTKGGYWTLEKAPHAKKNPFFINGKLALLSVGDTLPGDSKPGTDTPLYNPCIDFGTTDIGDYDFEYHVGTAGTACFDEAIVSVSVYPAPCKPDDIVVEVCQSAGVVKLWDIIEGYYTDSCGECQGVCKPLDQGTYEIITDVDPSAFILSDDGDGTNDEIDTEKISIPQDKDYVDVSVKYTFNVDTGDSQCQGGCEVCAVCKQTVDITFRIIRGEFAGKGKNVTVCCFPGNDCVLKLSDLVTGSTGTKNTWKYLGCNLNEPTAPDPNCDTEFIDGTKPGEELDESYDLQYTFCGSLPDGFYFFQFESCGPNEGDCCSRITIIVQVLSFGDPGESADCQCLCSNQPVCLNLFDALGGTPDTGGFWTSAGNPFKALNPCTGNGTDVLCDTDICGQQLETGDKGFYPDTGGDGTGATYNTLDAKTGVTYVFTYIVPLGTIEFDLWGCNACGAAKSTVSVLVTSIKEIGDGDNLTVCNDADCGVQLWDLLEKPKQAGCVWFYDGCASDSAGVDAGCTTTIKVGVTEYAPGSQLGTDDHVLVDFSSKPAQFYYFTYKCTVGDCEETAQVIIQVVEADCAGEDVSCDICSDDGICINLFDLLSSESGNCTVNSGGIWTDVSSPAAPIAAQCVGDGSSESCGEFTSSSPGGFFDDAGGNGTGATFNTTGLPNGTYKFKYMNVQPPAEFNYDDCNACNDAMATVTITIGAGTKSGTGNDKEVCN